HADVLDGASPAPGADARGRLQRKAAGKTDGKSRQEAISGTRRVSLPRRIGRDVNLALAAEDGATSRSVGDEEDQLLAKGRNIEDLRFLVARLEHVDRLQHAGGRRPQDDLTSGRDLADDGLRVRDHDPADLPQPAERPQGYLSGDGAGDADVPFPAQVARLDRRR